MEIPKDVYEYLTNFADNRTILNMLSVNKKFNDEEFFKRVMLRKYPLLIRDRRKYESMKQLFIRMSYYISKLEEDYDIPYIPTVGWNPQIYEVYKDNPNIINMAMKYAAKGGHLDILQSMMDRGATYLEESMAAASEEGRLDIIKFLISKGAQDFNQSLTSASAYGQLDIVKFMIDNGADDFDWALEEAIRNEHLDIVKLLFLILERPKERT